MAHRKYLVVFKYSEIFAYIEWRRACVAERKVEFSLGVYRFGLLTRVNVDENSTMPQ